MGSLLVLEEVVPPVKSSLVALARQKRAFVGLGPVDFALMAFEAAFVTEVFPITGWVVAVVWANMLVLMSPAACEYDCPEISKGELL